MNFIKKSLISLLIVIGGISYGQLIDGEAQVGIIASQIDGDNDGGYNKVSFYLGIGGNTNISDRSTLHFDILYARKGSRSGQRNPLVFTYRMNYIDFPLTIKSNVWKDIIIGGGAHVGYLINAQLSNGFGFVDRTSNFNRLDYGIIALLGYKVHKKTTIDLRYNRSVVDYGSLARLFYNDAVFFGITLDLSE